MAGHGPERFRTLDRNQYHLGRLGVLFEVDSINKKLFVNVLSARDLSCGYKHEWGHVTIHLRVQLLPFRDERLVTQSLFKHGVPRSSKDYKKRTFLHKLTTNPIFDEEFVFDLTEVWSGASEFRVFLVLWASEGIAIDGTGFLGCMSFPLQELMGTTVELPRWWWFLPKIQGLSRAQPVEHEVLRAESLLEPDLIVSGRSEALPNSLINGRYQWLGEKFNSRDVYKQTQHGLYLYFHSGRGAWAIGDSIGSTSPFAFLEDQLPNPAMSSHIWNVFSKGRELTSYNKKEVQRIDPRAKGTFQQDMNVICHVDGVPIKRAGHSQSQMKQPSSSHVSTTPMRYQVQEASPPVINFSRSVSVTKLVNSQLDFVNTLTELQRFHDNISKVISQQDKSDIFGNLSQLYFVSNEFASDLRGCQFKDPSGVEPLTDLLASVVARLSPSLVGFCQNAQHVPNLISLMISTNPAFADELSSLQQEFGITSDLASLCAAPSIQVQKYPALIQDIILETPKQHPDNIGLQSVLQAFRDMAIEALRSNQPPARFVNRASVIIPPNYDKSIIEETKLDSLAAGQRTDSIRSQRDLEKKVPIKVAPQQQEEQAPPTPQNSAHNPQPQEVATSAPPQVIQPKPSTPTPQPEPPRASVSAKNEPTSPVWYHGEISKGDADNLLQGLPDGTFLVRNRPGYPGDYVLGLVYKGNPTHHLVARNAEGVFEINKKVYGAHSTIQAVVDMFRVPVTGWPVLLQNFVPSPEASTDAIAKEKAHAVAVKKPVV